jgi:hypothetical protein
MLQRDDDHRDAGLQEADIARAIGQHRHVRANGVFGFGALEPGRTRRDVAAWIVSSLTFQRGVVGYRPRLADVVCARNMTRGASTTNGLAVVGSVCGGLGEQAMDAAEPRRRSRSAHLVRRGLRTLFLVGPVRD